VSLFKLERAVMLQSLKKFGLCFKFFRGIMANLPTTNNKIDDSDVIEAQLVEDGNGKPICFRIRLKSGDWVVEPYTQKLHDALTKILRKKLTVYSRNLNDVLSFHDMCIQSLHPDKSTNANTLIVS
jgi:hypothetical protein